MQDDTPIIKPPTLQKCSYCKKFVINGLKRCSKCKDATYCNVECQKKHWPYHKNDCREPVLDEDQQHQQRTKEFKEDYELPLKDTITEMVKKIGVQTQVMKLVGSDGSRKVKRSTIQDPKPPPTKAEIRNAWVVHQWCLEKVGSDEQLEQPSLHDKNMFDQVKVSPNAPHFPCNLCKPLKLVDFKQVLVNPKDILPLSWNINDGGFLDLIPLFPCLVKTPLLVPFLSGQQTEKFINNLELITFYQNAFRYLYEYLEAPDTALKGITGKRKNVTNAALSIWKLLNFHVQQHHTAIPNIAPLIFKTNYLASVHLAHCYENAIFALLGVDIEEDHHYTSPDPEKYEPKGKESAMNLITMNTTPEEELNPDQIKRLRQQILEFYKKSADCFENYPDFQDIFQYEAPKSDKEFVYKHFLSRAATGVLLDLLCRLHKLQRVDDNESSFMNVDGEFMDMIEASERR